MFRIAMSFGVLALCGVAGAATWTVDDDGPADFNNIQDAVDAASNSDEVIVAPGTYTGTGDEVVDMKGRAITLRASGTAEETIIDGEGQRRVVYCSSGEDADTVIEGFTITGGSDSHGGGVYCNNSSPTISGCTISNNTANYSGGGIYCTGTGSNPSISDCTISNNTASFYGGGIYCYDSSSPTITACEISNNTTNYSGGGITCSSSDPSFTDCTISDNTAPWDGGGIYCGYLSEPTITDCTITNNTASNGGGIYCFDSSSPAISGGTISNNSASGSIYGGNGGGIYCSDSSSPPLIGCVIAGNTATNDGGGIYCSVGSSPTISGCTACGNTPDQTSGNWTDNGGNSIDTECCPDPTNDGVVSSDDVQSIMNAWNCMTCDSDDVNFDGVVDVRDLLVALAAWGPCP